MATRIDREKKTIGAILRIFCRKSHGTAEGLCPECSELLAYAERRLERCRYDGAKPACSACPLHCYSPEKRDRIRRVMRESGPHMLFHYPYLTVRHWVDVGRSRAKS